jgi:NAD(P)-dependent dehydrogenase (short-subunit alcohol dehydrogenase family)
MTGLLDGDTALVTGAASGIGRGIARALAREGTRLVLTDVLEKAGEAVAVETGGHFVGADLTQPTAFQDLFDAALARLGSMSIFVHCAAPPRREDQTALAVSAEQWDEMMSITLRSGFLLGQAVGRHMRDTGVRGRMLYLTSLHAETPRNLPHYSAAKAGQTMLVKELARSTRYPGQRHRTGRDPGRGICGRCGSIGGEDRDGPYRDSGGYRRHGSGSALGSILRLCHRDHRRGRWRPGPSQLD